MSNDSTINMTSNRPYLLRAIYDWIADNNLTPYVLVDASVEGVRVPPQTIRNGQVVLNLAMQAVADLDLGNEWVRFKARFSGASHTVMFPVAAVLAIYAQENGQGMMFADEGDGPTPPPGPPGGDEPESDQGNKSDKSDAPAKRGAPHLKVVK
ncbi:MAG TPA: ClpXP protease specificity-enhancing factor [Oleiagrimonas sp.]|nr:ClpXP protease specificity-enhancing factor [Oleiagrimonas sp.]